MSASRIFWDFTGPIPCDCPQAAEACAREKAEREAKERAEQNAKNAKELRDKVQRIIGDSGINARFLRRTFDSYTKTKDNIAAYRKCKEYADHFYEKLPADNYDPGRNGLFITGPKGTGKTHLATAIANQLMQQGTAVVCMTMIDLLERIKQTFNQAGEAEADILELYKKVPLLIIDDIGKEPATEWGISKIYAIINARYEAMMPIIVTTNYTDNELVARLTPKDSKDDITADATIDRLREMCIGVGTAGESWRSK